MPYNFQGAGGIVNTGPIEDIYYLDSDFNVNLVPNNPGDAATRFYVDRHILEVLGDAVFDPNLVESSAVHGRIAIEIMPQADGINNIVLTVDTESISTCLLYTSPSPRDRTRSRMPSSA